MRAVIDTRFFILHFLANENTKGRSKRILYDIQREGNEGFVPTIVIHELYKFEYQTLGREVAELRVNAILKSKLKIIELTSSIAIAAAQLRCQYAELPTADAIVAASTIETASDYIVTDDAHLKQIKEIRTKWI